MSAKCIWVLTGIFWNITFVNHKINVQEAATVKCADQLEQGGFAMVSIINKAILRKDLGKLRLSKEWSEKQMLWQLSESRKNYLLNQMYFLTASRNSKRNIIALASSLLMGLHIRWNR